MRALDRVKPALYDALNRRFERKAGAALRRRQLEAASGRVLEVGGGTGANLPHYPEVEELVVTEPDEAMLRRARRRLERSGRRATLVRASAQALPFPDASFDTVVSTVVLCSVPDQDEALREIRRVLRPGGQLLFAEHVRSDDPRRARWQDRLERPWRLVAGGCHPNRDTLVRIEAAGFAVEVVERGELPHVPRLVRPYVAGRAVAPA
jgi:ubiquinone/menaquinone biosynthesis C-methylase UbiE